MLWNKFLNYHKYKKQGGEMNPDDFKEVVEMNPPDKTQMQHAERLLNIAGFKTDRKIVIEAVARLEWVFRQSKSPQWYLTEALILEGAHKK